MNLRKTYLKNRSLALAVAFASMPVPDAVADAKNKYATILYSTWSDYWIAGGGQLKSNGQPYYQPDGAPYGPGGVYHWWGKPAYSSGNLLNYKFMINGDPNNPNDALIDLHATQLYNAGIDFISIDLSNGTQQGIIDGARAVCKRYTERKAASLPAPKVVFFVNNPATATVVKNTFYGGAYGDIFFNFAGKPLILAKDPNGDPIFNTFTLRQIWGLLNGGAATQWSFKENTPINSPTPSPSYKKDGWPEERSVCAASQGTYMTTPAGRQGRQNGTYFDWHWNLVKQNNPTFVFITAWNEWGSQNQGNTTTPAFVDCYLTEYSADLEPMTGGHGSQYYNLLQTRVAEYKRNVPNLAIRDATTGTWSFKYYYSDDTLQGTNFTGTFNWAAGSNYQSFTGDFDNDGYNDVGLRDTSNGTWYFAKRNTSSFTFNNNNNLSWGTGTNYQAVTGDFNGDGLTDIGMRNSTTGDWFLRLATSPFVFAGSVVFNWTAGTDYEPAIADYNGDGRADLGLRKISNGVITFATQNTTSLQFTVQAATFSWAAGTDFQLFAGDFDRDGKGDVGLRKASTGLIYLANGFGNMTLWSNQDNIPYNTGTNLKAHTFNGR